MPLRVGPPDTSRSRQWADKLAMRFFMLREWRSSVQEKARLFSLKNQGCISRSWDWLRASSASRMARFRIRRRILHRPTVDRFAPFQCRCRPLRARSAQSCSESNVEKDSLCPDSGTRLCVESPRLYSGILLGSPMYEIKSSGGTATIAVTVGSSAGLGPKNLSASRGMDLSVGSGAIVILDVARGPLGKSISRIDG